MDIRRVESGTSLEHIAEALLGCAEAELSEATGKQFHRLRKEQEQLLCARKKTASKNWGTTKREQAQMTYEAEAEKRLAQVEIEASCALADALALERQRAPRDAIASRQYAYIQHILQKYQIRVALADENIV